MEYESNNKEIRELRKQIYYLNKYGETGVGFKIVSEDEIRDAVRKYGKESISAKAAL